MWQVKLSRGRRLKVKPFLLEFDFFLWSIVSDTLIALHVFIFKLLSHECFFLSFLSSFLFTKFIAILQKCRERSESNKSITDHLKEIRERFTAMETNLQSLR